MDKGDISTPLAITGMVIAFILVLAAIILIYGHSKGASDNLLVVFVRALFGGKVG